MSDEDALNDLQCSDQLQIDYARELNPQQLAAVTAPPGPALVIAGAGAGKTRTLTYRVAYLLEQGIPPDRILLLTFTNKAAQEMMRRVTELLGGERTGLWGGTFHSVGYRLLRRHALDAGFRPDFTILDRDDSNRLLSACLAEIKDQYETLRFPSAEVIGEIYSLAINTQKGVARMLQDQFSHFLPLQEPILKLLPQYQERKCAANVMDFDDLLALWLRLLQEKPAILEKYQRQFQFLLVDEYQDTNKIQSDLIDLLAARHHNLMVVGDDSQSIYAWRGANFKNILEFPQRYPEAATYKIETNYRSTPEILEVANAAIAANIHQFAKQLAPVRKTGPKPTLVACGDAQLQAAFVAQRALQLHEQGVDLRQVAVLYRSHFHALELQMELTRQGIPFAITSGIRFFEQAHFKDVTAYLKLVCNPHDEVALKRILQMLPGVGEKGAAKIWRVFQGTRPTPTSGNETPAPSAPSDSPQSNNSQPANMASLAQRLQSCARALPKKAQSHWPQLVETIAQLEDKALRQKPDKMIQLVLDAGYTDFLQATYENYRFRLDDLEQLARFASQSPSLEEFLAQLSLLANVESEGRGLENSDENRLRLSTIHQAKGLEFEVVFIIMLCEELFPTKRSQEILEMQEEERRLFYVAITRARNELYLCYPMMRVLRGSQDGMSLNPSRFLREIPEALLETQIEQPVYYGWRS